MFILVFSVSFSLKKSTLTVYADTWLFNFYQTFQSLTFQKNPSTILKNFSYRLQLTTMTSRTTIYLLFFFWSFFFFFGETLLLVIFNFNTLHDFIPSSYFMFFKTHVIFLLGNSNNFLNEIIFFYILFFTTSAFLFLLNLRFTSSLKYLWNLYFLDILFILIILLLFFGLTLTLLLILAITLNRLTVFKKHTTLSLTF